MLSVSTFGNTADIYAIVHLVPHACQHITVDQSHSSGETVAKILVISGEWRHKDSVLHKPPEEKVARGWVVYLLWIFQMFHGLMNNPVYIYIYIYMCVCVCVCVCLCYIRTYFHCAVKRTDNMKELNETAKCNHGIWQKESLTFSLPNEITSELVLTTYL